jgi:hypothetical protein
MESIGSAQEIISRTKALPADADHLRLAEEDWRPLAAACNQKPAMLLNLIPNVLPQVLPMLKAIVDAGKTEPKPPETVVESPPGAST